MHWVPHQVNWQVFEVQRLGLPVHPLHGFLEVLVVQGNPQEHLQQVLLVHLPQKFTHTTLALAIKGWLCLGFICKFCRSWQIICYWVNAIKGWLCLGFTCRFWGIRQIIYCWGASAGVAGAGKLSTGESMPSRDGCAWDSSASFKESVKLFTGGTMPLRGGCAWDASAGVAGASKLSTGESMPSRWLCLRFICKF